MQIQSFIDLISQMGPTLCVVFCSILPILETKIGIPLGVDYSLFGENALSPLESFFVAIVASSVMATILAIIFHFCFKKSKKKTFQNKFTKLLEKPIKKLQNISRAKKIFWCIMFVFLPVPFSGIYGATILCALIKLKLCDSIISVLIGNALSTFVEFLACWILKPYISLFLCIMIILITLTLLYQLIAFIFEKIAKKLPKNTE